MFSIADKRQKGDGSIICWEMFRFFFGDRLHIIIRDEMRKTIRGEVLTNVLGQRPEEFVVVGTGEKLFSKQLLNPSLKFGLTL